MKQSLLIPLILFFTHQTVYGEEPAPAPAPTNVTRSQAAGPSTEFWESYTGEDTISGQEVNSGVNVQDIVSASHEYNYASFGKSSPFIPPLLSSHLAKLEIPIVSVLQRYFLEQLTVVGIWTLENNARKALVMTSENEGVIVAVGDPIGNRGGKIISIEPNLVKVREFSLAPDGTRQFEDFDLWLGNEFPVEQEKIIIKSNKLSGAGGVEGFIGQDFLDTTSKEQNRMSQFMDTASDSMKIEAPAGNPGQVTPPAEAGKIVPPPAPPAGAIMDKPGAIAP